MLLFLLTISSKTWGFTNEALWPIPANAGVDPDALSNIEILLNAPQSTSQEVTKTINKLDMARETVEEAFLSEVNIAFEEERVRVVSQVANLLLQKTKRESSSFAEIEMDSVTQRLRVRVLPVRSITRGINQVIKRIDKLEKSRTQSEEKFIEIAVKEFRVAGDIYLKQVKETLDSPKCTGAASLLETSPMSSVLNVRVGTKQSEIYPRVGTQVWRMQKRRDTVEANERDAILFLTRAIFQAGNDLLKKTLIPGRTGVDRFTSFLQNKGKQDSGKSKENNKKGLPTGQLTKFNMNLPRLLRKRVFDRSELEVDVHPPAEHGAEALVWVDAITKVENEQAKLLDEYYGEEKRLLLREELSKMTTIVCRAESLR